LKKIGVEEQKTNFTIIQAKTIPRKTFRKELQKSLLLAG
jgi:hypothetical protein